MKVLVVGSGAREHALVNAIVADPAVTQTWCAPGNAGIAMCVPIEPVSVDDPTQIAALAVRLAADLVVIGPEVPLVAGAADAVRAAGIACFGPSAAAAQLEGSKAFAKQVMDEAGVSTAQAAVCTTIEDVQRALVQFGAPHVVKDDGLAAGKGVVVTEDMQVAVDHATACLDAGSTVVIEEYLDGPEVSLFGITDGSTIVALVPAQDFKRVGDGDTGPNTGGMGAYSPLPWAPADLVDHVQHLVLQPMIDAMAARGTAFSGLLYAGLALTANGIRVIEFNARFGDPETQVVLARLRSPVAQLLMAAATGTLADFGPLQWSPDAAVTVVIAANGYPAAPITGDVITGLQSAAATDDVRVLHAGTRAFGQDIVSSGGRVLSVTATGADLATARQQAYAAVSLIHLPGSHHRTDIALAASRG